MWKPVVSKLESTIRFFSYFMILTNSILAIYIIIVGLVYQILLRNTWSPTGLQIIVGELLDSINPGLAIIYWFLYEDNKLNYNQIPKMSICFIFLFEAII
ncbi:Pr6Pr family membrane protein [Epilithonimonas sp.]|uniref:Pr6Pr family membrane protein n=1 Tax=Epilithonimonas sp. TaxID=2894511 RepID=UPI003FA54B5A